MSWRDSLRPGSFRGVRILFQTGEGEGGRRGELHEYPERDTPWFEDLGRKARRWTLDVVILGPEYMAERDRLIEACEKRGTGTLVHPTLGELTVACPEFTYRETSSEGGAAFFSITFVEPGEPAAADFTLDTASLASGLADQVQVISPAQFASTFSVEDMPAFVEQEAASLVRSVADLAADASGNLGGAGAALRAYETRLASLPSGAIALVRSPMSLAHAVIGLVVAVAGLSASPAVRVRALRGMIGSARLFEPVLGSTRSRIRQRDNQAALQRLVIVAAASEAVRAASAVRFSSYDEAAALRDGLAEDLDQAAIETADAGDDETTAVLEQLRLAMVKDITARGGSLERLYEFVPPQTQPALLIAQQLHGQPDVVIERADELVERNHLSHPGFVPGGQPLQIRTLSAGGANG